MHVSVKAIYEVSPTTESGKYGVWIGRVESKVFGLSLGQW